MSAKIEETPYSRFTLSSQLMGSTKAFLKKKRELENLDISSGKSLKEIPDTEQLKTGGILL